MIARIITITILGISMSACAATNVPYKHEPKAAGINWINPMMPMPKYATPTQNPNTMPSIIEDNVEPSINEDTTTSTRYITSDKNKNSIWKIAKEVEYDKTDIKRDKVLPTTDYLLAQLYDASMAFVVPNSANINDTVKIQLLIDPSKNISDLESELSIDGVVTSKKIKISKIVTANLTAPNFKVETLTPIEQAIADTQPTEYRWNLTPLSQGKQEITLSINAEVQVGDKSKVHHIKTFEKTVDIEIRPEQLLLSWLSQYWQWLLSTLLLPFGIWLYSNFIKKKS